MRVTKRKKPLSGFLLILILILFTFLSACGTDTSTSPTPENQPITTQTAELPNALAGTQYVGMVKTLGQGKVRSWVKVDGRGTFSAIGISISEIALTTLPATGGPELLFSVPYYQDSLIPYRQIGLHWQPAGHGPQNIYDKPHFDIHFYLNSEVDRRKTTPTNPQGMQAPLAILIPQGYIPPNPLRVIPGEGIHWNDPTSPEYQGQPFTSTFVYGFYAGNMVFLEPMVTPAFLKSTTGFSAPLKLPTTFARKGYYPTSYAVKYDKELREYSISMEGMVLR